MAEVTRKEAEEQVRKIIKAYRNRIYELKDDADRLHPEGGRIVNEYCEDKDDCQILVQEAYQNKEFFKEINNEELLEYCAICEELNNALELGVKAEKITGIKTNINLKEIIYFLNNYKSISNWEYSGHGSFIAKKNATLWELGGIYWNKLFELPENPNVIQIGDEIKIKKEIIDKIYEYSISDVNVNYSFDSKLPKAKDLIYGIISFCAGASDKVPKVIKYGFIGKDIKNTAETLTEKEETKLKLSFFIQQYSTEGQEEDGWKKVISVASFLGFVFSALGLLSTASIEENKYQIVQYNQRKAFINSAQDEIKRIEELKSSVKETNLQIEIQYLRFLEKQVKMIKREIELNDKRDKQQINEIKHYTSQHSSTKNWKDTRDKKSSESYHKINYRKLFEEQE